MTSGRTATPDRAAGENRAQLLQRGEAQTISLLNRRKSG